MAQKGLTMRRFKEILRLHHEKGLSNGVVANAVGVRKTTVSTYLSLARRSGIGWPLGEGIGDSELRERLFSAKCQTKQPRTKPLPDFEAIHTELKRKGVTLQLLWEEYRKAQTGGYGYTQFCHYYHRWASHLDVSMRQYHKAGEKMFVDYAGQKILITNPKTGEATPAEMFVAVLGASNYTYAEASLTQQLPDWIGSHVRAFEYFRGVPAICVPDNLKSGITKPCRYEPHINRTYEDMSAHYGTVVIPARVVHPKDKAKVENAVLVVERWILAKLRDRTFYSLSEANEAIWGLLEELNTRPMQEFKKSRREVFESIERGALLPLPQDRYVMAEFSVCRVNIDYHVEVLKHYYSVPYQFAREKVEIRLTSLIIEVFHDGKRAASHRRSYQEHGFTTLPEHMPESHRRYAEWTPSRIIGWGRSKGEIVGLLFEKILDSRRHPEQGFRSCLGIIRLEKRYGAERVLAACRKAFELRAYSCAYRIIKKMLINKTESEPLNDADDEKGQCPAPAPHSNVRGRQYYLPVAGAVLQGSHVPAEGGAQ